MFKGFFNRMYYGKADKPDLTVQDVRVGRFPLFFEVLRVHWFTLVKLNLLTLLFGLPLILWMMLGFNRFYGLIADAGGVITAALEEELDGLLFAFVLGLVPCLLIMSPGLTAMNGVCRKIAQDEPVWLWDEFKTQLKGNWKQGLLIALIDGLLLVLIVWVNWLYGQSLALSPTFLIGALRYLFIFIAAILLMSMLYQMPMMVTYQLKTYDILRNSVLIALARLHFTLLFVLIVLLPALICAALFLFLNWQYALVVLVFYYLLFGIAFTGYIINAYTNATFDRYFTGDKKA